MYCLINPRWLYVKPMEINGYDVKVNFWDLSGHPEFYDVRNEFYKDTQGCLLVYDVTARRSFEQLEMWVQEARLIALEGQEASAEVREARLKEFIDRIFAPLREGA